MGLDWNPLGRPKPGAEAEFERLFSELDIASDADSPLSAAELDARRARFQEISEPPFVTLGEAREAGDGERSAGGGGRQGFGRPSCCMSQVIAGRGLPLRTRPLLGARFHVLP